MGKTWLKILCPVLAVALVAGMAAAFAFRASGNRYAFRVGYSMVSIQPDAANFTDDQGRGLALAGYGNTNKRRADYALSAEYEYDRLYTTCIAMADENDNTVILLAMDSGGTEEFVAAAVRQHLAKEYNIPGENVIVNASHTHSAPDYGIGEYISVKYANFLIEKLCQAADEAIADLTELETMSYGQIEIEQEAADGSMQYMNFTRHYVAEYANTKTGETEYAYVGDNFDHPAGYYTGELTFIRYTGHALAADPTMYMVLFERKDGKQPVVLSNFRAHPHSQGSGDDTRITSDTVGAFRYYLMQEGYLVSHYQGAAGMTNSNSYIPSDMILSKFNTGAKRRARTTADKNWVSGETEPFIVQYGKTMANFMKTCLAHNMTEATPHTLSASRYTYVGETNHNLADKYDGAVVIAGMWSNPDKYADILGDTTGWTQEKLRTTVTRYAVENYGIRSVYQANAAVSQKSFMAQRELDLSTVSVDGIFCIGACPNELFHQNSIDFETGAVASGKYKMAMNFSYTNGSNSYLPSLPVWDYTSYETDITKYAAGTGEAVAEAFCDMLGVEYTQTPKEDWK